MRAQTVVAKEPHPNKSTERITDDDVRQLAVLAKDIPHAEPFCLSRDQTIQTIRGVACYPWDRGLEQLKL